MSLNVQPLDPIGAEIVDPDVDVLTTPEGGRELMAVLEQYGVVLMRGLELDDPTQLTIARQLGEPVVRDTPGWSKEQPGIYRIALDPGSNAELYVKGSWDWHLDGITTAMNPPLATMLSCRVPAGTGGDTAFASTFAAYEALDADERALVEGMKIWCKVRPDAYTADIKITDADRERLEREPAQLHPLVWSHPDGRRSLVLGVSVSHVDGMDEDEGRAFLADLLDRATQPDMVLRHSWLKDDFVLWDNRGMLHRAFPYEGDSGRDMHRTTLVGTEPIR